ncbi:hypothetical protein ASD15_31385 [Massilia sp. Root351]|jgi:hypothetical protein|uniref:hypothetical protein n=1 Tax=Massilia sp. Root351 TaxID=1736522 RepID=UPI000710C42C|nr:hypothetical protein [Massilia sp. Root351]KQV81965.1 hypothetical protein ASD15_31385 [Massilia sp. Root351]
MKERETELIISITKRFIDEVLELEPDFEKGFFRFYAEDRVSESCASYVSPSEVVIVDAMSQEDFFDEMDEMCMKLLAEMGKNKAVLLLAIDKEFDYEITFEYSDMTKWQIALTDGGTGIPVI